MAQEWYLMNTDHDTISGFEKEDFGYFAQDTFDELLSASGVEVEICNFDLTERKPELVVMQGNTQDTKLNSTQRRMLARIGTCVAGQYVYYKNRYWLIIGFVDDNGMYEKAVLILCNYILTWRNDAGKIIQRWAHISSASQYNNGETSGRFMYVRSDQLMILTPDDDECLLLPHSKRFIIDMKCKIYEKNFSPEVTVDTSKPLNTYRLTRMDNVLFNYQGNGHSEFMASQDEQHEKDGYYVIDGKGYWLCEEPEDDESIISGLSCFIESEEQVVYNGLEPSVFTARFYDSDGKLVDISPTWDIVSDFLNSLEIEYVDNSICISVDDKKLINKSFELSLCADGYEKSTITVYIRALI